MIVAAFVLMLALDGPWSYFWGGVFITLFLSK